ncbi:hypothetical protein JCM5350_001376 [Sporobolomyces pararoseus]
MAAQLQMTEKHTLDVTWMLNEEQISKLRANEAAGTQCTIESERFGNDAWYLAIEWSGSDDELPDLYLAAVRLSEDLSLSSSTKAWIRKGSFKWTFSFALKEIPAQIPPEALEDLEFEEHDFDIDTSSWGMELGVTVKQFLDIYDQQKSIGFRCVLKSDHFPERLSQGPDLALKFYDSRTYADTVFVVHGTGRAPLHIFACKPVLISASSHFKTLFESGFSEATSRRRFDVQKLANHKKDDGSSTSAFIDQQLLPFYSSDKDATPQPPANPAPNNNDSNSSKETPSSEPSRKRIKLEEGTGKEVSETGTGKLLYVIDVHDTDFRTYRAMTRYLHKPAAQFLPVSSNYLVEHFANDLSPERPLDWLQKQFDALKSPKRQTKPSSAASMYRLSDLYNLEDLRELSLGFIIRSLTIHNVSFELFSPLSLDYEAVQKPILEFFVKNWSEVRKTKGFNIVLEQFSLGKLAKGKDLMKTIFEMISQS